MWHQGVPVFAIVLVVVGVLLLLQTTGAVSWDVWGSLWRFWPAVIIAIGLNIFLGRRAPLLASALVSLLLIGVVTWAVVLASNESRTAVTSFAEPLDGLTSVEVRVDFGAGDMVLRSLPAGSSNLVEGKFKTPGIAAQASLARKGERGELEIRTERRTWWAGAPKADWQVELSRAPKLDLQLNAGAADVEFDLRELQVSQLDVDVGAADIDITMPASAGDVRAVVEGGAADIQITIPQGVHARITSTSGLSSVKVDSSRFPKTDGAYQSPGYDTATNRIALELKVGAASVNVR
jgi:hypothetical protein